MTQLEAVKEIESLEKTLGESICDELENGFDHFKDWSLERLVGFCLSNDPNGSYDEGAVEACEFGESELYRNSILNEVIKEWIEETA